MSKRAFLLVVLVLVWRCTPVSAQYFESGQEDGTRTLGMKAIPFTPGAHSEPEVSITLGPLPSDWTSCQQDRDCTVVYFGPEPIGVNIAHQNSLSTELAQIGISSLGHAPGVFHGNTTPFCNRMTEPETKTAQQSLELKVSPGVVMSGPNFRARNLPEDGANLVATQGSKAAATARVSGARMAPSGCLAMPGRPQ
jgi:hypothetical protein